MTEQLTGVIHRHVPTYESGNPSLPQIKNIYIYIIYTCIII